MEATLDSLRPISLETLDGRASLLTRVDTKYVLTREQLEDVLAHLADDHDVLQIDGRREFAYMSVYFDTPDLRCYRDHVEGRRPRFKARTRCYLDAGACQFEVKLKNADDETDKRQVDHPPEHPDRLDERSRALLDDTLREAGLPAAERMEPMLRTSFDRITLAAREGGSRITCDHGLRLARMDGREAQMRPGLVIVETKSEEGRSRADELLVEQGHEPVSLSKYRTGIDLLVEPDRSGGADEARRYFEYV
jgi:hypothetical protein